MISLYSSVVSHFSIEYTLKTLVYVRYVFQVYACIHYKYLFFISISNTYIHITKKFVVIKLIILLVEQLYITPIIIWFISTIINKLGRQLHTMDIYSFLIKSKMLYSLY